MAIHTVTRSANCRRTYPTIMSDQSIECHSWVSILDPLSPRGFEQILRVYPVKIRIGIPTGFMKLMLEDKI